MPPEVRAALAALIVTVVIGVGSVASAVVLASCGASDSVRNDDPPPSTVSNRCGETGACAP